MHMDAVREIVLAQSDLESPYAQGLAKDCRNCGLWFHAGTLGRRYFSLYALIDRLFIRSIAN